MNDTLVKWVRGCHGVVSEPVQWARLAVGTRLRFASVCAMHTAVGLTAMGSALQIAGFVEIRLAYSSDTFPIERIVEAWTCFVIFFGSVLIPATYLVALRGLLREIDRVESCSNEKEASSS